MPQAYSKQRLYDIAQENYLALIRFCDILDSEGYWEQPGAVLKKSIYECLDWYVEAVMIQFSVIHEKTGQEQRKFIYSISRFHFFMPDVRAEFTDTAGSETMQLLKSPPILLQLCGLRDQEKGSGLSGLFLDALINIMLVLGYLLHTAGSTAAKYITEFYKRVSVFLYNTAKQEHTADEKYIFYKLSCTDLERSSEGLQKAGDNFEYYKEEILGMPGKIKRKSTAFADPEEEEAFRQHMKEKLRSRTGKKDGNSREAGAAYKEEDGFQQYIGRYEEYEDAIEQEQDAKQEEPDAKQKEQDTVNAELSQEKPIETALDRLLSELAALIGLTEVKKEMNSLINLIKVKKLREKHQLPGMDMSFHMVFSGSPGTGKTTVARLLARIYKEIGLLSSGHLVETDRSGLVAGFVGQTALKTAEVVERAVGGVLFIDEAYSLTSSAGTNDFGGEAVDALVKLMEDHRDDLVVIAAGYTDEMQVFLKANTGLISRFNKQIVFPDYSEEELLEIFGCMAENAGFTVHEEASSLVKAYLADRTPEEKNEFGNARGIRNLFEKIVVNQANRVILNGEPTIAQLTMIQKEDVISY